MVERTLKKTKNPKRVAAGKKAWRKAHRSGGRMTKRKRGRAGRAYSRAKTSFGRTVKAVVILFPAIFTAYTWSQKVTGTGNKIITGLIAFQMCYTGLAPGMWVGGSGTDFSFKGELLAVGWGPPLIIGGIQYGLKAVHMQGANPFRVMSQLG